jgi:hypothetical protein
MSLPATWWLLSTVVDDFCPWDFQGFALAPRIGALHEVLALAPYPGECAFRPVYSPPLKASESQSYCGTVFSLWDFGLTLGNLGRDFG